MALMTCDPCSTCRKRHALHRECLVSDLANDVAPDGAPVLTETSGRGDLIRWLCANDPSGTYRDADCRAEGIDVLTLDEARALVARAVR